MNYNLDYYRDLSVQNSRILQAYILFIEGDLFLI